MGDGYQEVQEVISIHAPTRGATKVACYLATLIKFQSTLPREERPVRRYSLPLISVNFNPRSHERSDNIQNLTFALTKRFQSTLPREERRCMRVRIAAPLCNFNPRSHERSDSNGLMMFDDTLISIHAPTRGATILCNHRGLVFGFQSTLPREERLSFPCNISFHLIFQSTLPREERQTMRKLTIAELNFNPRSHERSDPQPTPLVCPPTFISIHAPTRGATLTRQQ